MSNTVVVVAPHPDDETLGCGGPLLKHKKNGDKIILIIVTTVMEKSNLSKNFDQQKRVSEISKIAKEYDFSYVYELKFPMAQIETIPKSEIILKISKIFLDHKPNIVYLPFAGDAHSDCLISFEAAVACTKSFRHPYIKQIAVYETISESEFGINPTLLKFVPNMFVDISEYIEKKISIMQIYESEIFEFPFPRSIKVIRALSELRGSQCGALAAESFMLIKYIC